MKQAALSSIISPMFLFCSLLMVQALTSPHFTNTHHLQPRTTGVESIDHCLSSPYLNSRNILGTDDGADAELPTHLKDIEYALMEDTNFEVLEYLNKNPDSDTTLLWNTISQEMQSLATKDPESVIQSPNPKRQRVGMTTRADHPVMECKHSNCHQDSTSTYLERDQLDSLASNSDPEMFHSSHNTRERKSREKLTRIQHSAQASKARKHPKSKFQGSAKLPKIEGVEKELFYSHFQSRTIANLLKLKGTLALWHNHMVSRQIDSFFDNLDKNLYTTLWSSSEITYPSDKVILAIERIKTDIVIAFFGGLRMMLHIGQKDVSIKTVVSNGWAYLKQYLNQVFHLNQNELSKILSVPNIDPHNFSSPINLPNYMLKLDKNSPVQPSLIGALLSNWATEADHTPLQHKIEFSTQSFLSVIVSEAELRGKRIWATNHGKLKHKTSSKKIDFSSSMLPYVSELQMDELRKLKTGRPAIIFSRIGKLILVKHLNILEEIHFFCKNLENDLKKILIKANHSISDELKTYHSDSVIIDSKRIQNTISAVKLYLIPAFLGLLIVFHHDQSTDQAIQIILRTGWETLQDYFSQWRECLFEDTFSIIREKKKSKGRNDLDWHTVQDPIHYLSQHRNDGHFPLTPLWFLFELWYETRIQNRALGHDLEFNPCPPDQNVYHMMMSTFQTKGT